MSKLTHVRKALQDNSTIKIVGAPEKNYLPGRQGYWSHTVDFHVAPKTRRVYTVNELQALMMSLVPGLEQSLKDDFREWGDKIDLGKLYFDEDIGTEVVRHEIVLTDEDMFSSYDFVDGKRIIERTERVRRRTWIRLFPNAKIAAASLGGERIYRISKSELKK